MGAEVIADARRAARSALQRFGVQAPEHVQVEAWVQRLGIELVEAPLDGASAQLVRLGDRAQIVLPERVTDRGARRFSIAHELCHLLMKHPSPTPTMMCTPKAFRHGEDAMRVFEAGANAFAGEALLPEFLLRKMCEVSPVSLDVPWAIAKQYDVSILTSAIRFVELSSERCAAVFSAHGKVKWVAPSATFTREIPRAKRLDRHSLAWDFFAKNRLDDRAQAVPADAWFDTSAEVEIVEHSVCSAAHGTVLSLLWVPESSAPRLGML
jgi:Zn-dependent peptidase ImmA (M78 family)